MGIFVKISDFTLSPFKSHRLVRFGPNKSIGSGLAMMHLLNCET